MTPREPRSHGVVDDTAELLDALAAPFGTYHSVAACRPVPGAKTLVDIVDDLLCGLGKTEALAGRARAGVELVEIWIRAHRTTRLFVTGADALPASLWAELCQLGSRVGCDIIFVSAVPARWEAQMRALRTKGPTYLPYDPDRPQRRPPVGASLPDADFPGLPAACAELLDADHAMRAQAIYDDCLAAAFKALPSNRHISWVAADHAFRCALAQSPDLDTVRLAIHAVRAAGLLRGYHIDFRTDQGVAFDDLLTADRLAQLRRLVSPDRAAVGVLAGMPDDGSARTISGDGAWIKAGGTALPVPAQAQPLLSAWAKTDTSPYRPGHSAPPRPHDDRRRLLWRKPPPERLQALCEPIDCPGFRRIGEPTMEWTRAHYAKTNK
jgi:hypothetical protein